MDYTITIDNIEGIGMDNTIAIEGIEMNHIKISSTIAPSRIYDMDKWTLGAAVENYLESEILGDDYE